MTAHGELDCWLTEAFVVAAAAAAVDAAESAGHQSDVRQAGAGEIGEVVLCQKGSH